MPKMHHNSSYIQRISTSHEGGQNRSTSVTLDTSRQSKPHKVKSPNVNAPQAVSRQQKPPPGHSGATKFYDVAETEKYATAKSDLRAGTHLKDVPVYYFTASQLRNVKRSQSQDADLNRVSSSVGGQKPDVQHIEWSPSHGRGMAKI